MNRSQKRNMLRHIKNSKYKDVLEKIMSSNDSFVLHEGDQVKLNIDKITSHPDWANMTEKYKQFVMSHADTIFTVKYDMSRKNKYPAIVTFAECEDWLWWEGDLTVVKGESAE